MKIIVATLLVLTVSLVSLTDGRKTKKGAKSVVDINLADGTPKLPPRGFEVPTVPKLSKREQNKRDVLTKLRKVKNTEDFLKLFNIPYKKVKKQRKVKPLIPLGGKGILTTIKKEGGFTTTEAEKPEYDLYLSSASTSENLLKSETNQNPIVLDSLKCEPRPTVHTIPKSSGFINHPSCVQLNQCGGCCSDTEGYICKPTELSIETKQVYKVNVYTQSFTLSNVQLTHHKTCKCQCQLEQSDCLPTQTLVPDLCYCACERTEKTCDTNKIWSETECGCVCRTTLTMCSLKMEWNKDTCSCQCKKQVCGAGQMQDPATCYCVSFSG